MERQIKSFDEFKDTLVKDSTLQQEFKDDPVSAVNTFHTNAKESDPWIYRIIVLSLGITILGIIIGVVVLIAFGKITDDKSVPTIFTAIGSGAIGAFAGLLAPSPQSSR